MIRILDPASAHPHMAADWRDDDMAFVALARLNCILLADFEEANDLEDQIPAFVAFIACVDELLLPPIELEPSVRVTIAFVSKSVFPLAVRRVHDGADHGDTNLFHNEPLGVVYMPPKGVIARLRSSRSSRESQAKRRDSPDGPSPRMPSRGGCHATPANAPRRTCHMGMPSEGKISHTS